MGSLHPVRRIHTHSLEPGAVVGIHPRESLAQTVGLYETYTSQTTDHPKCPATSIPTNIRGFRIRPVERRSLGHRRPTYGDKNVRVCCARVGARGADLTVVIGSTITSHRHCRMALPRRRASRDRDSLQPIWISHPRIRGAHEKTDRVSRVAQRVRAVPIIGSSIH